MIRLIRAVTNLDEYLARHLLDAFPAMAFCVLLGAVCNDLCAA